VSPAMATRVVDHAIVVAYGAADPSDEEWLAYLDLVERQGIDRTVQLVVTDGGGPTLAQRRWLNALLGGRAVPTAVVTSSLRVRGIVAALALLNRRIRAFPQSGLRDALAYLGLPASRGDLVEREVGRLRAELRGDLHAPAHRAAGAPVDGGGS
jgi:hypothetical protein